MPVRDFNGSSDVITVTAPAYWGGVDHTLAAVVKRDNGTGYHAHFSLGPSGATTPYVTGEFTSDNKWEYVQEQTNATHSAATTADWGTAEWCLIVARITPGDSPYVIVSRYDGAWVHDSIASPVLPGTGPADWSGASPQLRFGNWNSSFNWFDGKMAMQALNVGTALDQTATEALAGGDRDDYVTAGFDHLWEFNQASTATPLEDYIGSLDQTAISGTSVETVDLPASSIYVLSADAAAPSLWVSRPNRRWVF
jgi:hypothetical protein